MKLENQQRKEWIDIVKGIGIFLVVLGHVSTNELLVLWIYSFHMPLFFFVSGWLMHRHSGKIMLNKQYICKKGYRLLIPFVEYRVILVVWWFLVERYFRELDLGPIWFLPTLFIAYIMVAVLMPYIKDIKSSVWGLMLILSTMIIALLSHPLPYTKTEIGNFCFVWLGRSICAGTWLLFGVLTKSISIRIREKSNRWFVSVAMALLLVINIVTAVLNGSVSLFNLQFGKSYLIYYASGISGIVAIFLFSYEFLKKNKVFEFLGEESIVIMAFHEPVKRVLFKVVDIMWSVLGVGNSYEILRESLLGSILLSFITIVLCCLGIKVINIIIQLLPKNKLIEVLFLFAR